MYLFIFAAPTAYGSFPGQGLNLSPELKLKLELPRDNAGSFTNSAMMGTPLCLTIIFKTL